MRKIRTIVAVLTALVVYALPAAAAPQLSAASISVVNNESWLLYGTGLDETGLDILLESYANDEKWDAAASLKRVLAAEVKLPATPPKTAVAVKPFKADSFTAAVKPYAGRAGTRTAVLWARAASGLSAPLAVNRPEIWTVMPARTPAAGRIRLFGPNMGSAVCLVSEAGSIRKLSWFMGYSADKGLSPYFERSVDIPADTAPGSYRLYVNGGGGDYGWSEPARVEVTLPPAAGASKTAEAPGDGEKDAAPGIQAAVDAVAAAGGGTVFLPAGSYRVKAPIRLKPHVTLRGAGSGATTLLSPRQGTLPVIYRFSCVVEMQQGSSLDQLAVDASSGKDNTAVYINRAGDVTISNCSIVNLDTTDRVKGTWRPGGRVVSAVGQIRGLTLLNNYLRGHDPFNHWGGYIAESYFGHNVMEGMHIHSSSVSIRGLTGSVIEHNTIRNGGRGLVLSGEASHNYIGYNVIENIKGIGNGCEMFLAEMGSCFWQGKTAVLHPDGFETPGKTWDSKSFLDGAGGYQFSAWALVAGGRGMGQMIPVKEAAGNRVVLDRPWKLVPDQNSEIAVVFGYAENLHLENQFRDGVVGFMLYGSGVRNVIAGDELERTSDGLMLWAISGPRQMSLNLLRDVRLQGRGAISLVDGRDPKDPAMVKMFGNEIRTCQIYERERYPGNEYGLGERVWRYSYNNLPPGNARHVTFGSEAGIHISDSIGWPGGATDEAPALDGMAPTMRWNMVFDSLVARCPVGIRIGRGIENTVIVNPYSAQNETPFSDSGRGTLIFEPTIK